MAGGIPSSSRTRLENWHRYVHESQSRLSETLSVAAPAVLASLLRQACADLSRAAKRDRSYTFYRAINAARSRHFIRAEADELDFHNLHIFPGFNLLRSSKGNLSVEDPHCVERWQAAILWHYTVHDAEGKLCRDVHWALGSSDTFQPHTTAMSYGYRYGKLHGVMIPTMGEQIDRGEATKTSCLAPREHIHQHGRAYTPNESH